MNQNDLFYFSTKSGAPATLSVTDMGTMAHVFIQVENDGAFALHHLTFDAINGGRHVDDSGITDIIAVASEQLSQPLALVRRMTSYGLQPFLTENLSHGVYRQRPDDSRRGRLNS